MKPAITLLAAALAFGLGACANDNDADNASGTGLDGTSAAATTAPGDAGNTSADATADVMARDTNNTPAGPGGAGAVAEADRKALAAVMEVDRHEIAAAGDALAKNVEGEVRSYAETLRDDHTRNLEATQRLLGDAGTAGDMGAHHAQNTAAGTAAMPDAAGDTTAASMPPDPEVAAMKQKHDAERQRLSALDGQAFASAWVAAMVKGHEEALAKLDNELIPGASEIG